MASVRVGAPSFRSASATGHTLPALDWALPGKPTVGCLQRL
jgi:hypothetical protein